MKRITDSSFRYIPAAQTDLRKTFARLRKEQRADELARQRSAPTDAVVRLPVKRTLP